MKSALVMTRHCVRCLWIFGALAVAACHSGDVKPPSQTSEAVQDVPQTEVVETHILGHNAGDYFGYAVAMSGDNALIGQPHDETHGPKSGAAYMYERQGDTWKAVSKLTPDDASADAMFGVTVAIDGDIAAVGAPGADQGHGAVYVFVRQDDAWAQVQRLTVRRPDPGDNFATAIALSGAYLLAGAPGARETGSQAGAVYVFALHEKFPSAHEVQTLLARDTETGTHFGSSVAVDGHTALIWAPMYDGAGAAYVFELQDGTWAEVVRLRANEHQSGDDFGRAVAIDGATALVGAPYNDHTGAVYIFERQADGWPSTATLRLTARHGMAGAQFGAAVAISDRIVLVGAYDDGHADQDDALGAAYLFARRPGEAWQERHKLPLAGEPQSSHFGYAVALNGPSVLIGAPAILVGDNGYVYPYQDLIPNMTPMDVPPTPVAPPPIEDALPVVEADLGDPARPETNRAPQIMSTPITQSEMSHVMPEIRVTDTHLAQQTITLNGQPYTPGTAITVAGSYELTVEATDDAGNTSRATVRFSIEDIGSP